MDITNLKTYLEVYRIRHFGKAAKNLCVTQSAVSARIRQLEEKLGVKLFTRDRNNIQPTAAGQKLFSHADSILNAWNRAQLKIALEDDKRIHIVIAGIPSLWDIFLTDWIIKINKLFPDVIISCEALSHELLSQHLMEGIADIGITYEPPQHNEIVSVKIIPINLIMVSSYPALEAYEAITRDYIYVDWGTSFAAAHAGYFPDSPIPPLRTGLSHMTIGLIKKRGGTAYLPETVVEDDLKNGRLYLVKDAPVIQREAHVIYRNGCEHEDLVREILDSC